MPCHRVDAVTQTNTHAHTVVPYTTAQSIIKSTSKGHGGRGSARQGILAAQRTGYALRLRVPHDFLANVSECGVVCALLANLPNGVDCLVLLGNLGAVPSTVCMPTPTVAYHINAHVPEGLFCQDCSYVVTNFTRQTRARCTAVA